MVTVNPLRAVLLIALSVLPAAAAELEPWCQRLLARSQRTAAGASEALPRSPFFHVDPQLLACGRLRAQIDTGPEGRPAADLRAACLAAVPSLSWEGAARHLGQVTLDIAELDLLAEVPGILCIMRPPTGLPLTVSQGVAEIGADIYHARGVRGGDAVVGILDLGFTGAQALQGTELPYDITQHAYARDVHGEPDITGGGSRHGTACAEIVHDVAPAARLCLTNARTPVEMESAVRWLIEEGVDIISHSVGWLWGPGDGTGRFADLVDLAAQSQVLWVNAVGNQATGYWGGPFRDENGDGIHEFDVAGDETITEEHVSAGTEYSLALTWDSWPESPDLSYAIDLYIDGRKVASSDDAYTAPRYAYREIPSYRTADPDATVDILLRRDQGSASSQLRLFRIYGDFAEHNTPAGSVVLPADAAQAVAVGAYSWRDGNRVLEPFSSRGPTLAGLAKPELCALDNVATVSENPFLGTSAAAPLAAGAAALLVSCAPTGGFFDLRWSIVELREMLRAFAATYDLGTPAAYDWGVLDLPPLTAHEAAQPGPRLLAPSPSRPPLSGYLAPAGPGPCRLMIFSSDGRLVSRRHMPNPGDAALLRWEWDGRGPRGRLPAGRYFMQALGAGWETHRALIVIR